MITIKKLRDTIINQTLPHDIINIEVFDDHVEILGLDIPSKLPNHLSNVQYNASEIIKVLLDYDDLSILYISSLEDHLHFSNDTSITFLSKSSHIPMVDNSWEILLDDLYGF